MNSMYLLIVMAGSLTEFLAKVLIMLAQAGTIPWGLAIVGIIILACISGSEDDK
jgi:hypothetical protein